MKKLMAESRWTEKETDRYGLGDKENRYCMKIWHEEFKGRVYQTEKLTMNGTEINNGQYPAYTEYAQMRLAKYSKIEYLYSRPDTCYQF